MRICIINEFFYPDAAGGTGTVLTSLAESLRQDYPELEISVITSSNLYRGAERELPAYEEWKGIHIHRVQAPDVRGLRPVRRLVANAVFSNKTLLKLLTSRSYDVILIGTAPPTLASVAHLYRLLRRVPYLYIIYDLDPDRAVIMKVLEKDSKAARLLRRAQRQWLHAAGAVVVLGRCMKEYVHGSYGVPEERIKTIPIGGNPQEIVPCSKATRFRATHGLTGFVVCYTGNFGRYHNFDTILDAAKELRESSPEIQFVLVGGGAQENHIYERVSREAIQNVHLFPFVEKADYQDLLASADVSLVTLEPGMEGLCVPSKFYSILASGRPTIALVSPKSEVARVVSEAECGVQLGQGDVSGLVGELQRLAANPQRCEQYGQNARKALLERYSSRHIAQAYYQAIHELATIKRSSKLNLLTHKGSETQRLDF